MLGEALAAEIVGLIAEEFGTPKARLRASLVGSQIIGLVMARYVIKFEPLASTDPEVLILALAGTLQRYLTGDVSTHVP